MGQHAVRRAEGRGSKAPRREILARIVKEFPESPVQNKARLFLAELDLVDGKASVAEKAFRQVLADPKADAKVREDGLSRLVAVAADKEDWPSVNELARKFISQFPKSGDLGLVQLNLAASQLGLKDPAAAQKTLVELKREIAKPGSEPPEWSARVWILLAEAQYQQRRYDDVLATVEELRRRLPKSPLLYQADEIVGKSYKNQAQWADAIAAFRRVVESRPGEQDETAAKSRLMIAEIWFLQKNYRQARVIICGSPICTAHCRNGPPLPCFRSGSARKRLSKFRMRKKRTAISWRAIRGAFTLTRRKNGWTS